jgi:hypothetical protein
MAFDFLANLVNYLIRRSANTVDIKAVDRFYFILSKSLKIDFLPYFRKITLRLLPETSFTLSNDQPFTSS